MLLKVLTQFKEFEEAKTKYDELMGIAKKSSQPPIHILSKAHFNISIAFLQTGNLQRAQ